MSPIIPAAAIYSTRMLRFNKPYFAAVASRYKGNAIRQTHICKRCNEDPAEICQQLRSQAQAQLAEAHQKKEAALIVSGQIIAAKHLKWVVPDSNANHFSDIQQKSGMILYLFC